MHVVVELPGFVAAVRAAGLSDDDRARIVDRVAAHPDGGHVIPGTGGARKVRFAGRGKGKSGGYRVITFYTGPDLPLFLITLFAKGESIDLSQAERNAMRKELAGLAEDYRRGVTRHVRSG
ncbi:MAG: type II toxin-antitoxin system RelE/ParE family toxin [Geminicoccaceae bacterium]